jgi:hypothetical protein
MMATKSKINLLKDMNIDEISLVVAPMCPEADVIFTKGKPNDWRAALRGDVLVGKANVGPAGGQAEVDSWKHEARDPSGRWTAAAIAAIGGKQGSYRRQIAQAFADKARAISRATVGHTMSAIKSTRPTGANPVRGGGVQFSFEHRLMPGEGETQGAKVNTQLQFRPEHLGAAGPIGALKPNKAQRALHSLHRSVAALNRPLVDPFVGPKQLFARATVHPSDAVKIAQAVLGGNSTASPTSQGLSPTSDQIGGVERRSTNGLPVWQHSGEYQPKWSSEIQSGIPKAGMPPKGKDGGALPFADASHETAGGRAYYRAGHFVPNTRPDVQRGIEKVHDWIAQNPGIAEETRRHLTRVSPAEAHGREYFTPHGDYVPPGSDRFQRNIQDRYKMERDRIDTADADAELARRGGPRAALFGPQTPGGGREYDTGTAEQRAAARAAAARDMTRKSLFPTDYPEHLVKRLPSGPYRPALFWHLDSGTPNFTSREAGDPIIKRNRKKLDFDA